MPSQTDIRKVITDQIIAALENGNVPPWRRPWKLGENAGGAANVVSERSCRGLNPILLDMASEKHGFSSKWWGTFAQWKALKEFGDTRIGHDRSQETDTNDGDARSRQPDGAARVDQVAARLQRSNRSVNRSLTGRHQAEFCFRRDSSKPLWFDDGAPCPVFF